MMLLKYSDFSNLCEEKFLRAGMSLSIFPLTLKETGSIERHGNALLSVDSPISLTLFNDGKTILLSTPRCCVDQPETR